MRSPWGRVLKGIREDEDAVRSLGKNVYSYKLQSLILGGVLGCFGGFIFAISSQSVQPDNYGTDLTFFAWAVLILGGAARVFGPDPRLDGVLVPAGVHRRRARRGGLAAGTIDFIRSDQVGQIRFWILGLSLDAVDDLPTTGDPGRQEGVGLDAR